MWHPSKADVAEIVALKKSSPIAAKHIDELMTYLDVAARKLAFYERCAGPDIVAKAAEAGLAGMTASERSVYMTKAAGAQRGILTEGFRLVPEPTAADRDALAKRADRDRMLGAAGVPIGKVMNAGALVDSSVLAAVKGASSNFRPAGTAKGF